MGEFNTASCFIYAHIVTIYASFTYMFTGRTTQCRFKRGCELPRKRLSPGISKPLENAKTM